MIFKGLIEFVIKQIFEKALNIVSMYQKQNGKEIYVKYACVHIMIPDPCLGELNAHSALHFVVKQKLI